MNLPTWPNRLTPCRTPDIHHGRHIDSKSNFLGRTRALQVVLLSGRAVGFVLRAGSPRLPSVQHVKLWPTCVLVRWPSYLELAAGCSSSKTHLAH